jgi:hypothetical protein
MTDTEHDVPVNVHKIVLSVQTPFDLTQSSFKCNVERQKQCL